MMFSNAQRLRVWWKVKSNETLSTVMLSHCWSTCHTIFCCYNCTGSTSGVIWAVLLKKFCDNTYTLNTFSLEKYCYKKLQKWWTMISYKRNETKSKEQMQTDSSYFEKIL